VLILLNVVAINRRHGSNCREGDRHPALLLPVDFGRLLHLGVCAANLGVHRRRRDRAADRGPRSLHDIAHGHRRSARNRAVLVALVYPGNTPHLLEGLTLCRLFWLLKLGRYSNTATRIGRVVRSRSGELLAAFSVVGVLIVLAAAGMWFFEKDVQPDKFGTIPLAMWWSVVTLTTIGYGDVFPISVGGRVFASFVALAGIGMIALPAGILAGAFSAQLTEAAVAKGVEEGIEEMCPTCGRPYEKE